MILKIVNNSLHTIRGDVARRLRSELKLKLALTVLLNLWFYLPYSFLQRHQIFSPTQISPSFADRLIPFSDKAVWVYFSLFLLMPIGPLLMARRDQLLRYGSGIFLIGLVAYLVFIFWPTWCERPGRDNTIAAYRILTTVDSPLNAFPSLHAAFAVFSALCAGRVLNELGCIRLCRVALGSWTLLILLATLLTKQHTLADITAGSALGLGVYWCLFAEWEFARKRRTPLHAINGPNVQPDSNII